MNAHCERFNRTVQEARIDDHYDLLFLDDPTDFNLMLFRYLFWYNLEHPHFSLAQSIPQRKTPRWQSLIEFLHQYPQCNMCWPDTKVGPTKAFVVVCGAILLDRAVRLAYSARDPGYTMPLTPHVTAASTIALVAATFTASMVSVSRSAGTAP